MIFNDPATLRIKKTTETALFSRLRNTARQIVHVPIEAQYQSMYTFSIPPYILVNNDVESRKTYIEFRIRRPSCKLFDATIRAHTDDLQHRTQGLVYFLDEWFRIGKRNYCRNHIL